MILGTPADAPATVPKTIRVLGAGGDYEDWPNPAYTPPAAPADVPRSACTQLEPWIIASESIQHGTPYAVACKSACLAHAAAVMEPIRSDFDKATRLIGRLHMIINETGLIEAEGSITGQVQSICDLAAALAQENERLKAENASVDQARDRVIAEQAALAQERDALKCDFELERIGLNHRLRETAKERDHYETERNELRLANERLTAERDRYQSALDAIFKTELRTNEKPFEVWDRMTEIARAALAPTQKEEA